MYVDLFWVGLVALALQSSVICVATFLVAFDPGLGGAKVAAKAALCCIVSLATLGLGVALCVNNRVPVEVECCKK